MEIWTEKARFLTRKKLDRLLKTENNIDSTQLHAQHQSEISTVKVNKTNEAQTLNSRYTDKNTNSSGRKNRRPRGGVIRDELADEAAAAATVEVIFGLSDGKLE